MAGTNKQSANELFGKISAYSTIVQQELWRFLSNFTSPYIKEYESTLDLIIDILRTLRYSDNRIIRELLEVVTGDASITLAFDAGYHGALNSLESKLALIETKQNNDSFITKLENANQRQNDLIDMINNAADTIKKTGKIPQNIKNNITITNISI